MPTKSTKDFVFENFDKMLLTGLFIFAVCTVIHITHDAKDGDLVLWAREMAGTVLGALLGLITGHALAASRVTTTVAGNPQTTTTAETNK